MPYSVMMCGLPFVGRDNQIAIKQGVRRKRRGLALQRCSVAVDFGVIECVKKRSNYIYLYIYI